MQITETQPLLQPATGSARAETYCESLFDPMSLEVMASDITLLMPADESFRMM